MLLFVFVILIGWISGWITSVGTKSQPIRLFDITGVGPLMIYVGYIATCVPLVFRIGLVYFGATTMTYNLKNYIEQNKSHN